MQRLAQIDILPAHDRQTRSQLRVDESTDQRDEPTGNPGAQDQRRSMDTLCDEVRIDEDAGTDDAAHYRHGSAKKTELARKSCVMSGLS